MGWGQVTLCWEKLFLAFVRSRDGVGRPVCASNVSLAIVSTFATWIEKPIV